MSVPGDLDPSDREGLRVLARRPDPQVFRMFIERYGTLVYASALRRTSQPDDAESVTRAVFYVLLRRARRLSRNTILAAWLFRLTRTACRKLPRATQSRWSFWRWSCARPRLPENPNPLIDPVACVSAHLDDAIDRLPKRQQGVVLLKLLQPRADTPLTDVPGMSDRRVARCLRRGLKRVERHMVRVGLRLSPETLQWTCAAVAQSTPLPENTAALDDLVGATRSRARPAPAWYRVARRTLANLTFLRWRRRILFGTPTMFAALLAVLSVLWYLDSLSGHSRSLSMFLVWAVKHEGRSIPGLSQAARAWPLNGTPATDELKIENVHGVADLYRTTNIWLAHLSFTRDDWRALQPERIEPLPHFLQPDGTALLRNPKAQRSGLAGVLGFDFNWVHADLDFGGRHFTNVAARIKGNGTYLGSLSGEKRAFKVDLNRFVRGQKIAGADELNFHNLAADHSFMSDALGYEFFRDIGVPAPRTAYAYLGVSVAGKWDRKPLGLYVMVEPVDADFALDHFGSRRTPIFKPVTYDLFQYLGDDWDFYREIYDLKTEATDAQRRRLIEFARLLTSADNAEFRRRLDEFLDLEKFADFLAGQVLLSNYDSLFSTGQNFYLYIDPVSGRFGFIPWDLDLAWGGFFLLGSVSQRERASIWHPWVGRNRFLERVLAVEEFRQLYRRRLEELLTRTFVPAHWQRRVDEMAAILREPVAAESDFRRRKFEDAISERVLPQRDDRENNGANRPANQIKIFVTHRVHSVRQQLDGKSDGVILRHRSGD